MRKFDRSNDELVLVGLVVRREFGERTVELVRTVSRLGNETMVEGSLELALEIVRQGANTK